MNQDSITGLGFWRNFVHFCKCVHALLL